MAVPDAMSVAQGSSPAPAQHRSHGSAPVALLLMGLLMAPGSAMAAEEPLDPARLRAALGQLPGLIEANLERSGVPGLAAVVVHDGRTVFLEGYGTRRLGSGLMVDGDTVFQLASVSKPIAGSVIAAVVGEGTIGWDTPVSKELPEVLIGGDRIGPRVTLRDLLSHRSGLPDHAGDDLEDLGYDRTTVLRRLSLIDTSNRFRAAYAYTNFGFTAAGEAAARASGRSWESLSAERLYRPLGMGSTSSRHSDYLARANRADLHQLQQGRWRLSPGRQPDAQSPAGGVSSSARDLALWMGLQLRRGALEGRPLVAAAALDETHRPQMISVAPADPARNQASLYGLGWNVGFTAPDQVRLSHSGAFAMGAATAVTLIPSRGLGIAVLTNGTPLGVPETVIASFLDLVEHGRVLRDYAALIGPLMAAQMAPPYTAVTAPAAPAALPLERYAGRYTNAYVGSVPVELRQGVLVMRLGPQQRPAPLTSHGNHRFSYQPVGENAGGPSAVTFRIGSGGEPDAVLIDNLNTAGLGLLERQPSP